ncbi:MAG: NAD(P)-dependent oxidoreductase, partial [Acidimicrobiales bacterium]
MRRRIRVLATAPLRGSALDDLAAAADLVLDSWLDHRPLRLYDGPALAERITAEDADVVISEADRCAGPVLDLPLLAIAATRGDPTNVDVAGATARGIPVLHTPGRNAGAVAEMTVGLLLAVSRGIVAADRDVRAGAVYRDGTIPFQRFRGWELAGRTAGVVGLGAVGRAVRWRYQGLGLRVIVADPFSPDATHDLAGLLAEADVVSMHAAVTPDNLGMMGAEQFAALKDGAVYVNT